MSSGLGSLTRNADPNSTLAVRNMLLAYCSSKAALNMITVQLANELKGAGIKVNSANPGFTATGMNQHRGPRAVEQGAATPVRLACFPTTVPPPEFSAMTAPSRGKGVLGGGRGGWL